MDAQKRKAIGIGLIGLILIVLGIKYMPFLLAFAGQQSSMNDKPVILFFNVDEPCECMVEMTQRAEQQMANWPVERRGGIPVMRIAMEERKDLEVKYRVFRAPCLVLVDAQGQIVWRQDYPLIEGGPFKLDELEAAITELRSRRNYVD
jgi:hypothetical protein